MRCSSRPLIGNQQIRPKDIEQIDGACTAVAGRAAKAALMKMSATASAIAFSSSRMMTCHLTANAAEPSIMMQPVQLTPTKVHLLRAPTKTSPNPPSSDNVLRMGEIGRVLFCSWET